MKKKMNIFLASLMVLFVIFSMSGCTDTTNVSDGQDTDDDPVVIGFSLGTLREERWLKDRDLFIEKAEELGAFVNVQFANNDASLQKDQVENLILQGVDVLVVVPQDGEKAAEYVKMAHENGIEVIAYDRIIKNSDLDYYVSFDNVKVGELQAQAVLDVQDSGDFAYIGGSPKDNNAFLLKEGSMNVLNPRIESGDIEIVLDNFSADWRPEVAYSNLKAFLDEKGTIDAVVCANDGTAFGAIKALRDFNLSGKVPVSGQDAELSACQRIISGEQTVTVYKPIKFLAEKAAEMAVAIGNGDIVEVNSKVDNGMTEVKSYLLEPVAVTKANMNDTIIADGFHSYEEVYG